MCGVASRSYFGIYFFNFFYERHSLHYFHDRDLIKGYVHAICFIALQSRFRKKKKKSASDASFVNRTWNVEHKT